jgi:hypothetical protein
MEVSERSEVRSAHASRANNPLADLLVSAAIPNLSLLPKNTQDPKPSPQLAALAIMLDRPHLAADPRLLCSTARVCRSWRAVVAASGCSSSTDVVLRFDAPTRTAATAVMAVQVG